jgi:hypothetical protein
MKTFLLFLLLPLSAHAYEEFVVERNLHYLYQSTDTDICRRARNAIHEDAQFFCRPGEYAYLEQLLSESCWIGDGRVRDSAEGLFRCMEIPPAPVH